jgi:hypothetical protein
VFEAVSQVGVVALVGFWMDGGDVIDPGRPIAEQAWRAISAQGREDADGGGWSVSSARVYLSARPPLTAS